MKRLLFIIVCVLIFLDAPAYAADLCVDESGSYGDGTSWAACLQWSAFTPTRGNDYYVGDNGGSAYAAKTFSTAASGTTVITIYKATESSHGPTTAWDSSYGDGQAVLTSAVQFSTSYWTLNGQTRDEDNWFDDTAYGFKINSTYASQISISGNVDDVEIYYVYLEGKDSMPAAAQNPPWYSMYFVPDWANRISGHVVSRCFFQYSNVNIFTRMSDGMIIEYSAFLDNESNSNNHGEALSAYSGATYSSASHDFIIRYNKSQLIRGTNVWAIYGSGHKIYGNVDWDGEYCTSADGYAGFGGGAASKVEFHNVEAYNNTIIGNCGFMFDGIDESGNIVRNNLWITVSGDCPVGNGGSATTYSNNGFNVGSGCVGSDNQYSIPTSVFNVYASDDFTLSGTGYIIDNGYTLTPDGYIDYDMLGVDRDADSGWDIGAYEYDAGAEPSIIKKIMTFFRRLRG